MYYVYILKSQKREKYYIGLSSDVDTRLAAHNAGYTKSTRPYRPWMLLYQEAYDSRREAAKREWHLKHPAGYIEKKKIIAQYSARGGFA